MDISSFILSISYLFIIKGTNNRDNLGEKWGKYKDVLYFKKLMSPSFRNQGSMYFYHLCPQSNIIPTRFPLIITQSFITFFD